jgi:hypothetical protein
MDFAIYPVFPPGAETALGTRTTTRGAGGRSGAITHPLSVGFIGSRSSHPFMESGPSSRSIRLRPEVRRRLPATAPRARVGRFTDLSSNALSCRADSLKNGSGISGALCACARISGGNSSVRSTRPPAARTGFPPFTAATPPRSHPQRNRASSADAGHPVNPCSAPSLAQLKPEMHSTGSGGSE